MPGRRVPGTQSEGSGMGLAIVRKIAQYYGGTVRIESGPDEGTAFVIVLPSVGDLEAVSQCVSGLAGDESIPEDRRLDHNTPHEDPQLHSHRARSRRTEPRRRFSASDG